MMRTWIVLLLSLQQAWAIPCSVPADISLFAFIVVGDAMVEAKRIDNGIYVGMIFEQILADNTIEVNGMSIIGDVQADNVHWNGGLKMGSGVNETSVNFEQYEYLAENVLTSSSENSTVLVYTSSGGKCWTNDDFVDPNTLVIFNTWEDICLSRSSDGLPFSPTVIAPFSMVQVEAGIGMVSGSIVARELVTTGANPIDYTTLEFVGEAFIGTLECRDFPSSSPSNAPSTMPSAIPSDVPSLTPSAIPSDAPSDTPSMQPSSFPSNMPSSIPSDAPSTVPSAIPSEVPSIAPSAIPSIAPSSIPSDAPSIAPSAQPSSMPSDIPSLIPSSAPSMIPSVVPSDLPSYTPSTSPSEANIFRRWIGAFPN
jgi:hypothetical protein